MAADAASRTGRRREPAPSRAAAAARRPRRPPAAPPQRPPPAASGPLDAEQVAAIRAGYAFEGAALEMGALVNGDAMPDVPVRIPLAMTNRHGLVAGATGTGKTRTLQVLAEQLAANGVAVFAADIKGDLSGVATPGRGQREAAEAHRGHRAGVERGDPSPSSSSRSAASARACRSARRSSGFGPLLLSKVLGLNDTQESSLGLVFHYAENAGLALLDLEDLRAVLAVPRERRGQGRARGPRRALEGDRRRHPARARRLRRARAPTSSSASPRSTRPSSCAWHPTAAASSACSRCPASPTSPALYSTFLMWLLADLFNDLPEVGDLDKPKLVFFFDEAHLLFNDASKDFLAAGRADRAPHPLEGRRRVLRHADPEGRARRRARAARLARAAPAARVHARRREGPARDRLDVPEVGLRPRGGAHDPRHRRGDRHRHEREGRPEPRRLDPPARAAGARCRRRPRPRSTPRSPPRRCRRSTARRSTASRRTSCSPRR